MRIALDAMGGDHAPSVPIEGAIEALLVRHDIDIILVGIEQEIKRELKSRRYPSGRISIRHAPQVVEMQEAPSAVLRKKKESSIRIGIDLVKTKSADAFVSAGNSGAVMAASLYVLGVSKGVDRPAIATLMPTIKDRFLLLDVGANVDCRPDHLLQFALMGSTYCKLILGRSNPKVALLSIGEEDTKGNELTKEAFKLLKRTPLNFIGNVEGKDIFKGKADVVVCDGFIGNVALKLSEGLVEAILKMLKREIINVTAGKLGYFMLKPAITNFKRKTDYDEYGGAPLLGINGASFISHGRSSAKAIKNAILAAADYASKRVFEQIACDIEMTIADRKS